MFNNAKQIRDNFVRNGWDESVSFDELSLKEAIEKGYTFAVSGIKNGKKYFKMNVCGNIYDDKGKVVIFNVRCNSQGN
jgi:hypothetical protein